MLDDLLIIAKIISFIAIPVVLWWLGTCYQSADTKAKTAVEYVKLSISIIQNQNEADPALLEWASNTLNHYSEIKFSKPLVFAIAKGQANISPASAASGWFAVVGSLISPDEAEKLVQSLQPKLPSTLQSLSLQIHKTDISKLYAVTVGGETSKSKAVCRASSIRESGLVSDAYAQKNRGWKRVEI